MPNNNTIRDMIDSLIACDDQPSEARLGEVRKALEQKVGNMKKKGDMMQRFIVIGLALMLLGIATCLVAYHFFSDADWLWRLGFSLLGGGWGTVVISAIIRARYHGLDYVWARDDLHEAAMMDLSLQVQQLAQRIDALDKKNSLTS